MTLGGRRRLFSAIDLVLIAELRSELWSKTASAFGIVGILFFSRLDVYVAFILSLEVA